MTRAVVVDNSALCRFRFRESGWRLVRPLVHEIEARRVVAYAPPHLLIEFFHVAQKKAGGLSQSARSVKRHYDWLMGLPIQYVPVDYLQSASELRRLVNRGAGSYDAIYIHLAQRLRHPLCTCDTGIVALHDAGLNFAIRDLHQTAFAA